MISALQEELDALNKKNLFRSLEVVEAEDARYIHVQGKKFLNFASNNYLGLSTHKTVQSKAIAAIRQWGAGSGASRLVSGNLTIHEMLEKKIASFKKEEAALIFSSGYLANLGAVTALVGEKDLVLVDRLNHASLIDAARLSRAKLWVYPHRDMTALAGLLSRASGFRRKLVLTDAYFSMDGDVAPLDRLSEICRAHDAMLMVDEAHSTGVFGKRGSGLVEQFGLSGQVDVVMGTLSKALGSVGGFITGKKALREFLINHAREFVYTTAPAPSASAAALGAIQVIEKNALLRTRYWKNIHGFRKALEALDFNLMGSEGPIVPVLIGDSGKALQFKEWLRSHGIFAPAIRPPTVPKGTDRIRFSLTAVHTPSDLDYLVKTLKKAKEKIL